MMNDDRIVYAELLGQRHPMCLTVAASGLLSENFGSMGNVMNQLRGERAAESLTELAAILMEGGRDRLHFLAGMEGCESDLPPVLDLRKHKDHLTLAEWAGLTDAAISALSVGLRQTVEVAPPKKSETTQ